MSRLLTGELREVEKQIFARQRLLALLAIGSVLVGVFINEMCAGGDYREASDVDAAYQAFLEDPSRPARSCEAPLAALLKIVQTALTGCLLLMIVARFRLRARQSRVIQQLKDHQVASLKKRGSPHLQSSVTAGMALSLAGELLVCSVHTLPFFHMDIGNEALGRLLYYRAESLLCGFMFVRLYHVYLWQEQSIFLRYFNLEDSYLIKDHKTIKLTQECATSHRTLAFKVRSCFPACRARVGVRVCECAQTIIPRRRWR